MTYYYETCNVLDMRTPSAHLIPGQLIRTPKCYNLVQPYADLEVTLVSKCQGRRWSNGNCYDVWDAEFDGTPARVYLNAAGSVTVI